jgi:hypothetical protein
MKITVHAAQRFLERVISKESYSHFDVKFAMRYLEKLLMNVVPGTRSTQFVLPGFENYKAIYRDGTIITIIPKGENHAN